MNKIIKTYSKIALGLAAGVFCFTTTQAQINRDSSDLKTEEVVIIKGFEPTISEASKINYEPKLVDVKAPKVDFNYDFIPKVYDSKFIADSIKAARIKGEPLDKLYRAFLKLGIGNYGTTYGRFHLNNLRSRNNVYGLKLYHHGSQGNVKDLPNSQYNTNGIEVGGKKFLKAHAIEINAGYDRQLVNFYGMDKAFFQSIDIDIYDIEQIYQEIKAAASFESFYSDSTALNYKFNLKYTNLSNAYDDKENNFVVDAKLEKYFGKELGQVFIKADYNDPQLSRYPSNSSNLLLSINPQINAKGDKWNFSAGLIAFIENEDETKFRFYPNANFKYNVFNDLVIPYIGVTGGMSRNSMNSMRKDNPFIDSPVQLINSNTRYNFYGGVKGTYSSTISFNLQASRKQVANMPLFENSSPGLVGIPNIIPQFSSFNVIYDTINITQLTAEIGYLRAKKLNLIGRVDYFSYDPNNEPEAWHMPDFKATVTGRYDLRDKIVLKADIFYVSKRYAKSTSLNDERLAAGVYGRELDGYLDANLGIEYRYNKKWSAFLNLNNIASQTYQEWDYYDSQRFNLLFGLTYSFWGN